MQNILQVCSSLFFTGLVMGSGPCLATCGPILISYIAATKRSTLGGLWSYLIFSLSRISIYIILGCLAGFTGSKLFQRFYWETAGYIIWFAAGAFIILLAVLIFLGRGCRPRFCALLNESLIQHDTKSLVVLGILIGIFPCMPLIGVLSYITMVSTHLSHGILLSACFGLGTIISPLIFLGMFAGAIPKLRLLQDEKNLIIFQRICAVILLFLGSHIVIKIIIEYIKAR